MNPFEIDPLAMTPDALRMVADKVDLLLSMLRDPDPEDVAEYQDTNWSVVTHALRKWADEVVQ